MKKNLLTLAQFATGFALIWFIFFKLHRSGKLGDLVHALGEAGANWPLLVVAVLLFFLCLLFCVQRWNLLLHAQGFVLPFHRVLALFCVGQFFNAFMFGATGGDVVKAYYVAAETHQRKTEVITTVFVDRIIGLIALVLLTGTVMLFRLPFFLASRPMKFALVFSLVQILGTIAGITAVMRRNVFEQSALFRRLEERTSLGKVLARAYSAFQICLRDPRLLAKTVTLSMVNHIACVTCVFYLGMAIGVQMSFLDYLTVFPVINSAAAMPITPSGLGTRESVALYLLGVLGVPASKAVTVSLFLYATILFWSLVGGVVYFFFIYLRGKPAPKDLAPEEIC